MFIALKNDSGVRVSIKDIAEVLEIPGPYLAKILQTLVRHKLLSSVKGPNGGFFIERELSRIAIFDVVLAIDGSDAFSNCGLGMKKCSDKKPCPMHGIFKVSRDTLKDSMMKTCLDKVIDNLNDRKVFILN